MIHCRLEAPLDSLPQATSEVWWTNEPSLRLIYPPIFRHRLGQPVDQRVLYFSHFESFTFPPVCSRWSPRDRIRIQLRSRLRLIGTAINSHHQLSRRIPTCTCPPSSRLNAFCVFSSFAPLVRLVQTRFVRARARTPDRMQWAPSCLGCCSAYSGCSS